MRYTFAAVAASAAILSACSSVPSFQDFAVGGKADGTSVMPVDIVEALRCELREVANKPETAELKNYVVAAALTLRVDDSAGLLPSVSFIDPYKVSGTNWTFGVNGQFSGTRQRLFTQTVQFKMSDVASSSGCAKADVSGNANGFHVNGINLLGKLGLDEIAQMGLAAANKVKTADGKPTGLTFPDPAKATDPATYDDPPFGSTVQFTLTKSIGLGPTWTLTHFKGPSGTAGVSGNSGAGSGSPGLLSGGRTDTHLLLITFGPKSKGHGFKALDSEASATAQSMLTDLRLQLLQGAVP